MSPKTAYIIKDLEWEEYTYGTVLRFCYCASIFGTMRVEKNYNDRWQWSYCFNEYYDEDCFTCDSLEDGKAKANEFYLSRLIPGLENVSSITPALKGRGL